MDNDALHTLQADSIVDGTAMPPSSVSYDAAYIVLSFFTSLIGCITTLELLQRRTSTRGAYNWFLLLASAITMGGVGIWGMHFVGNRAIVLQNGDPQRQILYNPGFTALSFFMPIVVLIFAFYTLGMPSRARLLRLAIAGFLTGAAVCGMHYLGQLGVENYHCSYRVQNVVGAAIIAVLASFIALSVFFRLRETWTDSWWKRLLCGCVLALAVSGMHWSAAVGTIYVWKGDLSIHGNTRTQTAIIAASLSIGSCVILLAVTYIRGRNLRSAKKKSQRLVLACAYFDEDGKLMVTQEGILPSEKITNHYVEKHFGEDELSRSHATYLWIFRASHNWAVLRDLIPNMKDYLETDPTARKFRPSNTTQSLRDDASDSSLSFAPIFKQLFCAAAQQLANLIHEPLERLGVLFEEPLETGAIYISAQTRTGLREMSERRLTDATDATDAERGISSQAIARGKYLFLHRRINRNEAAKFAALGFRFATIGQIAEPLAKRLQVDEESMVTRFERMKTSASPERLPAPGVHLACFMLRPSMYKSFDVLVPAAAQNQLPCIPLQIDQLSPAQTTQLQRFDESSVSDILKVLVNQSNAESISEDIRWQLYNAFVKLVDLVGDYDTMMNATFSAKAFTIPCRATNSSTLSSTCTVLTVRVLRNIHASSTRKELTYVPLTFFGAQQQVQTTGFKDETFERKVRAEFGHLRRAGSALQSGASSHRFCRRSSSATSSLRESESPRASFLRSAMGRLGPRRRSDETTMVERDKSSMSEELDFEMNGVTSTEHGHPTEKRTNVIQSDIVAFQSGANEPSHWVSEVFSLFQLGAVGWTSAKSGGWKWDVNVENSFEVGSKDRRKSSKNVDAVFLCPQG